MHIAYTLRVSPAEKLPALPGYFKIVVGLFWIFLVALVLVLAGHYVLNQRLDLAMKENTRQLTEFNQLLAAASQEANNMDRAEAATERLGLWIKRSPDPQQILHAALYESPLVGCKINQFSARLAEGQGQISFTINLSGSQESVQKARDSFDARLKALGFRLVRSALEPSGSGGAVYTGIFLTI